MVGLFRKDPKDKEKKLIIEKKKQLKKFVKEKNYSKVQKTGSEILEKNPYDIDILFILGGLAYIKENFSKSISLMNRVLEIGEYDPQALLIKANSLVKLGKINEAISCCNKIKEIDPKNKDVAELLQTISNSQK